MVVRTLVEGVAGAFCAGRGGVRLDVFCSGVSAACHAATIPNTDAPWEQEEWTVRRMEPESARSWADVSKPMRRCKKCLPLGCEQEQEALDQDEEVDVRNLGKRRETGETDEWSTVQHELTLYCYPRGARR